MQGIILERELLVEGWDFVDDGEDTNEDAASWSGRPSRKEVVCPRAARQILHYYEVVGNVSALVSDALAMHALIRTRR